MQVVAADGAVASAEEVALHATRHEVAVAGVDGVDGIDEQSSRGGHGGTVAVRCGRVDGRLSDAVRHRRGVAAAPGKRGVRDVLHVVGRGSRVCPVYINGLCGTRFGVFKVFKDAECSPCSTDDPSSGSWQIPAYDKLVFDDGA